MNQRDPAIAQRDEPRTAGASDNLMIDIDEGEGVGRLTAAKGDEGMSRSSK